MAVSLSRSTKSNRNRPIQGMQQIKAKISDLQLQYDELHKQRQQDIAHLITTLELSEIHDQVLVGALLYIKEKISTQAPLVEVWQQAGERFLQKSKSRKYPAATHTEAPSAKTQSSQKSSESKGT